MRTITRRLPARQPRWWVRWRERRAIRRHWQAAYTLRVTACLLGDCPASWAILSWAADHEREGHRLADAAGLTRP